MRAIIKPNPPTLNEPTFASYATALGSAVGRYCSFCEKDLSHQLGLFHKQHGVLTTDAQLSSTDWADLLLICEECSVNVSDYNPQSTSYYWPDTPDAKEVPYLYQRYDNVAVTVNTPDGGILSTSTQSAVLISVAPDISQDLSTRATNTYKLFGLNGKFIGGDVNNPTLTLPYSEYVSSTDIRLVQRLDAHDRGVEAANALIVAIPIIPLDSSYPLLLLSMFYDAIRGFGYFSTWRTAIESTLNAADPSFVPKIMALLGNPTSNLKRKEQSYDLDEGFEDLPENVSNKRFKSDTLANTMLARAIPATGPGK